VVAVLGGQVEVRPFAAAELYQKGLVTKILVSQVAEARSANIGAIPGHTARLDHPFVCPALEGGI
jgi:hypothetical protein